MKDVKGNKKGFYKNINERKLEKCGLATKWSREHGAK